MSIYIAMALWLIINGMFAIQTKSKFVQEKSVLVFYVFFILIYAFRAKSVGFDYSVYQNIYEIFEKSGISGMNSVFAYTMEKGYLFLNYLFASLNANIYVFQAFVAIGICYCVNKFISMEKESLILTIFFLYTLGFFFNSMNQVRSCFAVAICLWAIKEALDNRLKKAIILVVIACTLHVSAALCFVIILIIWKKIEINKKNISIALVTCILLPLFWNTVLSLALKIFPKYKIYFSEEKSSTFIKTGNITYLLLFLCIIIFALYRRNDILKNDDLNKIKRYDCLIWLAIVGAGLSVIVLKLSMVQRFIVLPLFSTSLLITMGIKSVKYGKYRLMWIIFICSLLCFYMYIYLKVAENGLGRDGVVPYSFYWNS